MPGRRDSQTEDGLRRMAAVKDGAEKAALRASTHAALTHQRSWPPQRRRLPRKVGCVCLPHGEGRGAGEMRAGRIKVTIKVGVRISP